MPTPQDVIDDIRQNYGVDLRPDSPNMPVITNMRSQLTRALQLLSRDLYAKDIHFVLELLQNSDDNAYAPGVEPFVRLVLTDDAILLQNNELGFVEENVRSLCDVGKSSKTKRLGYIGEKGIGFKSVFRVTDEPYIVSNGFSFSLPLDYPRTNLGYVIPVWREIIPAEIDLNLTNILLPLTSVGKRELPKVADIQASLLLFLRKLRRIEIHDASGVCTKSIYRQDKGNWVQICSDSTIENWKLVGRTLQVPNEIREEKRQDVSSVELLFAFPVNEDGSANASAEQPVYSFLPIKNCGFRFAIQADFVLASSREDFLSHLPWNQWLRDSIPAHFLEAVEQFKADSELRTNFLAFVPSAEQITDPFFKDIRETIIDLLKETACILTASDRWAEPANVFLVSDALRSLISNEEAQTHLNKEFISESFQANTRLLETLGVKKFGINELLTCLRDSSWLEAKNEEWLIRLYAYLSVYTAKDTVDSIREVSLVLLENGELGTPKDGQIFFPLDRRTSYGFETGLRIVRKRLFKAGDEQTREAARKFLRSSLGIRSPESIEIINQHILPIFEGSDKETDWKCKDDGFRIGSIEYIKDHLDQFLKGGGSLERLTKSLFIKQVHPENRFYAKPLQLYLSKVYGNESDLEAVYRKIDGINYVDPVYLKHSFARIKAAAKKKNFRIPTKQKREVADQWKTFFVRIGVETVLRVTGSETSFPYDFESNDLEKVIKTREPDRLERMLRMLDSTWERYEPYQKVSISRMQRGKPQPVGSKESTFLKLMLDSEWISTQIHGLCKPSRVCIECSENREILGNTFPYLKVSLSNDALIASLKLQKEPTVSMVLACLRGMVESPDKECNQIRRLYEFLDKHFESDSAAITRAFQDNPLTFVPDGAGRFCLLSGVFWKDMSRLFGNKRGYLSKYWRDLREFFVDKLKVRLAPAPNDYVELLKELSQEDSLDCDQVEKVWECYRAIETLLASQEDDEEPTTTAWWKEFESSGLYWTDNAQFWSNDGDVYINDRQDYYELFKGRGSFTFLALPENQFPSFRHLIEAGKLQLLSEAVQVRDVTPWHPRHNQELTTMLRDAIPFIVRYLYFKNNDVYRDLQKNDALTVLSRMSVLTCDGTTVVIELHGESIEIKRDVAQTDGQLYLRDGVSDAIDLLGFCVSDLLRNPPGLGSFICLLLTKENRESMERLMEAHRISTMPTESGVTWDAVDDLPSEHASEEQCPVGQLLGTKELNEELPAKPSLENPSPSPNDKASQEGVTDRLSAPDRRQGLSNDRAEVSGDESRTQRSDNVENQAVENENNRPGAGQVGNRGPGDGSGRQGSGQTENDGTAKREQTPRIGQSQNWFRVLASPEGPTESSRQGLPPPNDDLARRKVIEYEQRRSRPAVAASPNQKGFDVSSDDVLRSVTRRIEVKGLQQRWTGDATVALTGPQYDACRQEPQPGVEYWVYVVDGLGTDAPRVHPIYRPAAKVERVYFQAQDWLAEVDQTDRDRLTEKTLHDLGVSIIEFNEIANILPNSIFVTCYPGRDLVDVVPAGGLLKCHPLDSNAELPARGRIVMLLPTQLSSTEREQCSVVGEFRWSVRQSPEGEPLYVEVFLRPKAPDPCFAPVTLRVSIADWPSFRPYAVCEALLDT